MSGPALVVLQVAGPSALMDLPGVLRAPVAFSVVLVLGAGLVWRYGGVIDRSIDASIDRPLASMGYGVAAHLAIGFFGVYAASQVGRATGQSLGAAGLWLGVAVFATVAAMGFTVVGSAIVSVRGDGGPWHGLVVGAAIAGTAALFGSVVGGLVWVVVVSMGIGGFVRRWFHASEGVQPR